MSIENMTYGASATMEFNAGYERAQEEMRQQLENLRTELVSARESLAMTQIRLVDLQSSAAVRMVAEINPLINSLAQLMAPQLEKIVESKMQEKIDNLGAIDDERIKNLIQGEIDDRIEGEVEQAIDNFDFSQIVRREVRSLDFEVSVS
jgi:hypothetical protein